MEKDIKLVIFDMDGLMLNTEAVYLSCGLNVCRDFGYANIDEHFLRSAMGLNTEATGERMKDVLGISFNFDEYIKLRYEYMDAHFAKYGIEKKPGLDELLDYLDENGIIKAVATSTPQKKAFETLEKTDLLKRFDYIITGDMVSRSKPEPDIFLKACETAGVAPDNSLVLEDSHNGLMAAVNGGMRCILIPDLALLSQEDRNVAYQVLPDLSKVIEFVK